MDEQKANGDKKRLLLRLEWPRDQVMAVEVNLERDFLERLWKLMLICEKDPGNNALESQGHRRRCSLTDPTKPINA
jgi:hypothetical protein